MEQLIEYLAIVLIGLGVLFGLTKGLVRIFFSWFSIFLGVIIAMNFSYGVTKAFFPAYSSNILLIFFIGLVLFSIIYLIVTNFSYSCSVFFHSKNMSGLDHILGGVLGGCQTMIIVGLAIYWIMVLDLYNMSAYPVSMFSAYWAEKIILLVGTKVGIVNKLIK